MTEKWQGEFVSELLNLEAVPEFAQTLALEDLVGVALRKNPKRAHLLVSKVLGKHYPQSPAVIKYAAKVLAQDISKYFLYREAFATEETSTYTDLSGGFRETLKNLLNGSYPVGAVEYEALYGEDVYTLPKQVVVFGYAETATALGASIAHYLDTYYINSTRYPDPEAVYYGGFEEEHSHASSHHLTPEDQSFLDDSSKVLVLVDDEITTGNTIINTIKMMHVRAPRAEYIVATLVDLRDAVAREKMEQFASELGVKVRVFSLFSGHLELPVNAVELAQPAMESIKAQGASESRSERVAAVFTAQYRVAAPNAKNGLQSFTALTEVAEGITETLKKSLHGSTLVLGVEEDMYLPLYVAQLLEYRNQNVTVKYSTTTRSPVLAYNDEGYAIQDRIKYVVPETENDTPDRFSYNIGQDFDNIILITDSKTQTDSLRVPETGFLDQLKHRTKNIFIMEAQVNPDRLKQPLTGPAFGSYKPDDVEWLLTDLSHAELEGATEDREEAIQQGGAHYAESLPVEYQPTPEYQELFKEALEEGKQEMAESVAFVSEQIHRIRTARPVLVSLARAGTPVGILIKRYLKAAYGYDAPHYAISIVRGKGIDYNALNYIVSKHDPEQVIFVDGWTGKGAIINELTEALKEYEANTGVTLSNELAVLADPARCVTVYGTRDDFLIPSACLNSTVSGLISRTVLNKAYLKDDDYHGAKFYAEFADNDFSNIFLDTVEALFDEELFTEASAKAEAHVVEEPDWGGWKAVERISEEYGINNVNLVKPGTGETTRVLLRRVPWKILIRADKYDSLLHIRLLAENREVPIEIVDELPYATIGLIHPKYTKGATGFDGGAA